MLSRKLAAWFLLTVLVVSLAIGGLLAYYTFSPDYGRLTVSGAALDDQSRLLGIMILCPEEARKMGLCNPEERDLDAKYRLTIDPPPPPGADLTIECHLVAKEKWLPIPHPYYPNDTVVEWNGEIFSEKLRTVETDATGNFTCSYVRTDASTVELDVTLRDGPDQPQLIFEYVLIVDVNYAEDLLPFRILARSATGIELQDLCVLAYNFGKHPSPPDLASSTDPLGEFSSCEEAVIWQRQTLGILASSRVKHDAYADIRLESTYSTKPTSIDGLMLPQEWSDAARLKIDPEINLYVKNDNEFLYLAVDSPILEAGSGDTHLSLLVSFDVDHDSMLTAGRDVVYFFFWPSGFSGFARYSKECEFVQARSFKSFVRETEEFLRSSACVKTLSQPAFIKGNYDKLFPRFTVEMEVPLKGEDGIMTAPRQTVGVRVAIDASICRPGEAGCTGWFLPSGGFIHLVLAWLGPRLRGEQMHLSLLLQHSILMLPVEEQCHQDHHSPYSDVEQVAAQSSQNYEGHTRSGHPTLTQLITEVFHPFSSLIHESRRPHQNLSQRA